VTLPSSAFGPEQGLVRAGRRRLLIPGVLLAFVLLGALAFYFYWWRLPAGTGPAGPVVARDLFQTNWTTRPVLLVGLGDSVTAGFGASDHHSYFELLVTNAPDDFPAVRGVCLATVLPNLQFINLALSGSTSLQHLRSQIPRLPAQSSNVLGLVVMTTGGNDIIHNYGKTPPSEGAMYGASLGQARPWITNFEQRLHTVVTQIESRFPGGCRIFLANIYDPTDGVGSARRVGLPAWPDAMAVLEAYNGAIAACAARHRSVHVVNIHDLFLGHGLYCSQFWRKHYRKQDPHHWFCDILEDPNDRGYDALRRLFLIEMARTFRGPGRSLLPDPQ
jgi:lysophospholipase L1-like esterase